MSEDVAAALAPLVRAIEDEFARSPPTICVIGLSGVGKSSTLNRMFGTRRHVSATTRGTSRFHPRTHHIASRRLEGTTVNCALRVIDAPGLGEDVSKDENYLARYRRHLPKADVALWMLAARNRALALDQQYLERLLPQLPSLVIGINQVDIVDPLSWDERLNLPSREQAKAIEEIVADRAGKLGRFLGETPPVVAFSAQRAYNLQALYAACLKSAPARRRWMFELLKSFSTMDWLNQAKGLSEEQRAALANRHVASDRKLTLDQIPE